MGLTACEWLFLLPDTHITIYESEVAGLKAWKIALVAVLLAAGGFIGFRLVFEDKESAPWVSVNREMAALLPSPEASAPAPSPAGRAENGSGGEADSSGGADLLPEPEAADKKDDEAQEPAATDKPASGGVNINTASATRLTDLPGIGPSKANAIVAYREANGPFRTPEELKKVKGIGEKTYEKLKDKIAVGP